MASEDKKIDEFTPETDIRTFFKDTNVFITGGTGFVGQVLLSKLLISCSNVKKIYFLMRQKKGKNVDSRLVELFEGPVFEKVREHCPDYRSKVAPIRGDCSLPNLGISEADVELLQEEVNIVFHVAATVHFQAPLRNAVNTNVRSTNDLLVIAKQMKNLKVFVYVSTLYAFCGVKSIIKEKMYQPPIHPQDIITLVDNLNDKLLEKITPSLLGPYKNTYVFTKAIAESLCHYNNPGVPIAIFRPAIIVATAEDPVPGWINNTYGPTGLLAGATLGLLRLAHIDGTLKANIVPCDYTTNALIASAWYTAETWKTFEKDSTDKFQVPVFNNSSTEIKNIITWQMVADFYESCESKVPLSRAMGPYFTILNKHKFMYKMFTIFLHTLPAIFVDGFAVVCGKEPRLLKTYQKIHKFSEMLSYFGTNEWRMPCDNVLKLWSCLCEREKEIFKFDIDDLDWKTYFINYAHGIRLYIMQDKEDTIPSAIKRRRKLKFIFCVVAIILSSLFSYCFFILYNYFF